MHIRHHTPHPPHSARTDPPAGDETEPEAEAPERTPEEPGPITATEAAAATKNTPASGPVFVDSTGRRAKVLRRAGWAFAAACACYTGALGLSLSGATPIAPRTLLPLPGVPATVQDAESAAGPADTAADIPVKAPAQARVRVPLVPMPVLPSKLPVALRTKAPARPATVVRAPGKPGIIPVPPTAPPSAVPSPHPGKASPSPAAPSVSAPPATSASPGPTASPEPPPTTSAPPASAGPSGSQSTSAMSNGSGSPSPVESA